MVRVVRFFLVFIVFIIPLAGNAQMTANFGVDHSSGCSPVVVNFTDSSTGTPVHWHWIFDSLLPGDTSNLQNPSWIYTAPGHYNVKLVVTYASGLKDSVTKANKIFVASQPVVRFTTPDTIMVCPPRTITFTNTSDTGGCTPYYTWFIDTSSSIHTKNATYTFTHGGNYDITLQETDACGCNGYLTKTAYVKIDTAPVVCFATNDTTICSPPASVCFNSCSSGAAHYLWNFGDGVTDTVENPCHTYSLVGSYSNTLTATAANGCALSVVKAGYIQVNNFAPAFYTVPAAPLCANTLLTFHDTASGTASHHWTFSSAATDTSSAATPTHAYTAAGTYTVTDSAWNASGCHGVTTGTVVVKARPVVTFTGTNAYRCSPNDTVSFTSTVTDASGVASRAWNFGDAGSGVYNTATHDTMHIYTDTGYYNPVLIVTDNNGCVTKDSVGKYINIHAPVVTLSVTKDSGCLDKPLHYSTSISPTVAYHTDSVTFGDGSKLYTDTGSHYYLAAGAYEVHHYYHLATGCSYSDSIKVLWGSHSVYSPVISADSVCQKTVVNFVGNCTTCTHESWNTGAGPVATVDSTSNQYTLPGIKTITYLANSGGCVDTLKDTVFVFPPTATFTIAVNDCSDPHTYNFTNTSTGAINFHWNFGDGSTDTARNPVAHTYSANGTYSVSLTDADSTGHGCVNGDTIVIHIAAFALAFTANNTVACKAQTITFTGPLTSVSTRYAQYKWSYGDGLTDSSTTSNLHTHVYSATGTYTVTLVVKNAAGCTSTIVQNNYIRIVVPSGGVTPDSLYVGCAPLTVHFHDADTGYNGAAIAKRGWAWNTGSPTIKGYGADTAHLYLEGSYQAVVFDTDSKGCFVADTIQITAVKPHAYFSSVDTAACKDVVVEFTDTNSFANRTWYFGDGSATFTTADPEAVHTYTANGLYTDTLIIVTVAGGLYPEGCRDTTIHSNYINVSSHSVHVSFSLSDTFQSCPTLVTLAIRPDDGNYYQWRSGIDSATFTSTSSTQTFAYSYPGIYHITLIDSALTGCKDSLKKTVTVLGPTGMLHMTADSGCLPLNETLYVTYTGLLDTPFTWSTPTGVFNTDTSAITQTYTTPGSWNPFVVIQRGGCLVTVHTTDSIRVFAPEISVNQPALKCKYDTDTLNVHGLVNAYVWAPASGLSCTNCATTIASPTVTTTYTVTGLNGHGCSNTAITTVYVDAPPVITISGQAHICTGASDTLSEAGISGSSYAWYFPSGSVACATCDTIVTTPAFTQLYTFVTKDSNDCNDSATFLVTVDTLPVVSVTPLTALACVGSPATLTAMGAATYSWSPAASLSCGSCGITASSPSVSTTYTVIGTDAHGCKDTATALVNIDQLPDAGNITGSTEVCVGATVILTDTTSGGAWSIGNTTVASITTAGVVTALAAGTDTVKYSIGNSCGIAHADLILTVNANPVAEITTHSPASVCTNTMYQNFGTSITPVAGTSYTWTAENAAIYAVDATHQYCLVNFTTAGASVVKLTAEAGASGCSSTDVFAVTVGSEVAPTPTVIFYAPDELVCTDNSANSYQWGYDDKTTLDSTLIPGAVNQDYFNAAYDFTNRYYWVMTTYGDCVQKTYYVVPEKVTTTTVADTHIALYPNPANSVINVEITGKYGAVDYKLYDMRGNTIRKGTVTHGGSAIDLSDLAVGVYMVLFTDNGAILGSKTFVKN